ncbi:DUF1566 domain-containing protein [Vibrio navarrensis]|uniref:DUF1566 domain-containing protein n=2 Tax=Vibrionaceae TaxID=641 RepID=A0AAJ4IGQ1_9VIBR|nr:DUF1566 domain-containing protein [Vibrio navarrensis]
MRCGLGQSWDGKTCNGEAKEYKWRDAIKLKHNFAGSTAWRLPTIDELESLVLCSEGRHFSSNFINQLFDTYFYYSMFSNKLAGQCRGESYQKPTINLIAFPNTGNQSYWSSSPFIYRDTAIGGWGVYFGDGAVVDELIGGAESRVRFVRDGR